MISKLSLIHFQSHKKTTLEFCPGVNCIVGPSNSGKTAILRGLFLVLKNRPSGQAFISHWNQDKKGNPIKPTIASLERNGILVNRVRSTEMNGYQIIEDGKEEIKLEAIGMDVPHQIPQIFQMEEVNIQRQMDAPFLLSQSAGDVARFFNMVIRLDLIDRVLSKAETKRRNCIQDKKSAETNIKNLNGELEKLDWIDEASGLLDRMEAIEVRCKNDEKKLHELKESLMDVGGYKEIIEESEKILVAVPIVESIEDLQEKVILVDKKIWWLRNSVDEYLGNQRIIDKSNLNFSLVDEICKGIVDLQNQIREDRKKREMFEQSVEDYDFQNESIKQSTVQIEELEKSLPDVCPLCGAKIRGDDGQIH